MKLNSLASRPTLTLPKESIPVAEYSSPGASFEHQDPDGEESRSSVIRMSLSDTDMESEEDEVETLTNRTMSLFLNAATNGHASVKKTKVTGDPAPTKVTQSDKANKSSSLLHRRKTLC
jgi:hypothetical protein